MRSLREMLTRHPPAPRHNGVPPPITGAERDELARATVRIEKKWKAMDQLFEDYQRQDRLKRQLGHRA